MGNVLAAITAEAAEYKKHHQIRFFDLSLTNGAIDKGESNLLPPRVRWDSLSVGGDSFIAQGEDQARRKHVSVPAASDYYSL